MRYFIYRALCWLATVRLKEFAKSTDFGHNGGSRTLAYTIRANVVVSISYCRA